METLKNEIARSELGIAGAILPINVFVFRLLTSMPYNAVKAFTIFLPCTFTFTFVYTAAMYYKNMIQWETARSIYL